MLISVNLPYRPHNDPIELVGVGVFPNMGVYEVAGNGVDIIIGERLDLPPVKVEDIRELSETVKFLLELTDEELDTLGEENKITFGDDMTTLDKALALESVGITFMEGDD